jgi:PTH2 family peptidyl-tRNA hydrolase
VEVKLVIVVRSDLEMGKGKIAAQVAHAAVAAALGEQGSPDFRRWLSFGQPKVVLRVTGAEALAAVCRDAVAAGLPLHAVRDAGRTQVDPGTPTCAAIGPAPADRIDPVTATLRLL